MEGFKEFLDSSSIHGISFISSEKRFGRLFWIFIVLIGFTGAFLLIRQSFNDWEENPISTTSETLPMSHITFPNITVCPPRNSYLNMNFDIIQSEKIKIDDKLRKEFYDYSMDVIQENYFQEWMTNLSKIEDPNRYYNWYYGYTKE